MKFSTHYERKIVGMKFDPETSLTHTDMKKQCDINNIVEQYVMTGTLPSVRGASFVKRFPMFGDFTVGNDFQTIQNTLKASEMAFLELPSRVRERFHNNPAELVSFLQDEGNRKEAEDLGLIDKVKVSQQIDTAVKPDETAKTEQSVAGKSGTETVVSD